MDKHIWYVKNISYDRMPYFSGVVIDLILNKSMTVYDANGGSWDAVIDSNSKEQFQENYWGIHSFDSEWIQVSEEEAKEILKKIIVYRKNQDKHIEITNINNTIITYTQYKKNLENEIDRHLKKLDELAIIHKQIQEKCLHKHVKPAYDSRVECLDCGLFFDLQ